MLYYSFQCLIGINYVKIWWFSPGIPVSFTNKTYHHDIAERLLKMALNTITLTPNPLR
jgi:hypothetical protein